jgi:hypothetical protein
VGTDVALAATRASALCILRIVGERRGWELRETEAPREVGGQHLAGDLEAAAG